jgi:hypothetical protein
VRDERLDGGEVHDGLGLDALTDVLAEDSTQERSLTRVDADDLPLAVDLGDFDLVGGDETTANQVDQVSRQQVFGEQELTGTALESTQDRRAYPRRSCDLR